MIRKPVVRLAMANALLGLALLLPGLAAGQTIEASGTWTTSAPLPDRRTEVSVASDGERLYVVGGFSPGRQAPRAVYVYDPKSDWSHITDLPEGVNHAGLAHINGKLYVVGGYREASFEPTDALRIYDTEDGAWHDGPPLPTPRGALAVAVHDGRIHAIGGVGADGERTGVHEAFNPRTGVWTTAAPMPTPRDHLGAAAVGDRIIAVAGRDDMSFTLTNTEIYDAADDVWRGGADVPTGRSGVATVDLDGYVYLFGGETFSPRATFGDAERYDPNTDSWMTLPAMPTARHGLGAGVLDGRIHVVSGGSDAGLAFSDVHEVLIPGR